MQNPLQYHGKGDVLAPARPAADTCLENTAVYDNSGVLQEDTTICFH